MESKDNSPIYAVVMGFLNYTSLLNTVVMIFLNYKWLANAVVVRIQEN